MSPALLLAGLGLTIFLLSRKREEAPPQGADGQPPPLPAGHVDVRPVTEPTVSITVGDELVALLPPPPTNAKWMPDAATPGGPLEELTTYSGTQGQAFIYLAKKLGKEELQFRVYYDNTDVSYPLTVTVLGKDTPPPKSPPPPPPPPPPPKPALITLGDLADRSIVKVKAGDTVEVRLTPAQANEFGWTYSVGGASILKETGDPSTWLVLPNADGEAWIVATKMTRTGQKTTWSARIRAFGPGSVFADESYAGKVIEATVGQRIYLDLPDLPATEAYTFATEPGTELVAIDGAHVVFDAKAPGSALVRIGASSPKAPRPDLYTFGVHIQPAH